MSRRRTSADLTARARELAGRAGIPYSAALAALRTPHTARTTGPAAPDHTAATGLPALDGLLGPLTPGTLTVLAGRTMAGTTALLLGIARHHGHRGRPALLASLQIDRHATMRSLLAAEAGQDLDHTAEHAPDGQAATEAAARLDRFPIRVLTPDGSNAVNRLRAEASAGGPGLLLLDSLRLAAGLESSPPLPGQSAAHLVALARELDVPAVATAHLNPRPGDDDDSRPRPDDLDDPGVLAHAHRLVLLHRPARLGPLPGQRDLVTLHIARPDGTEAGITTMLFEPEYHRMVAPPRT
ncbi:DnaB-like helicase C-terminal domain-containing protein [Streptomyces scabiei]|uniref:DnaB-like helicase C-terminal domain-containing protein n=1 Tax=Streptomyces scabiei TaxID=1930 RepID=UPI002FF202E1